MNLTQHILELEAQHPLVQISWIETRDRTGRAKPFQISVYWVTRNGTNAPLKMADGKTLDEAEGKLARLLGGG